MRKKFVIIGGGVAGLSAAIHLAELGEEPLIIEGGSYPSHKICGEFLSPESIPLLAKWNIHPVPIPEVIIKTSERNLNFAFPKPAGGLSHLQLDLKLADYARKLGAEIKTETHVESFDPKTNGIHLKDALIEAENVIIATGRIPSFSTKPQPVYLGFKAHFKDIPVKNLEMFSLPGAYLGISPVEDNLSNVACIADLTKYQTPEQLLSHPLLHFLTKEKMCFPWMITQVPSFGIQQTPNWPNAYFIGDASVRIPPASGEGLSLALIGGQLAASYALKNEPATFKALWHKRCRSQMLFAKGLHTLMLNPTYSNPLIALANRFPIISRKLYTSTRQSG
jgi:flavin-dependent dehydrogenase